MEIELVTDLILMEEHSQDKSTSIKYRDSSKNKKGTLSSGFSIK